MRQRNACVSTRAPGYHLKGTETRSASWSRARSSSTSRSVKISAPPRANGTCGRSTAILMSGACGVASSSASQTVDLLLEVVDQAKRCGVERALVVCERLDVPTHELPQNGLDRRADATSDTRAQAKRAIRRDRPEALRLGARGPTVALVAC